MTDVEMSKVIEQLRTMDFPTVDVTMNDTPIVFKLDDASLESIRAIVREEVSQMRSVGEMADALEEVITSAPDDEDGMRDMLLDWLREIRLS